MKVIPITSTSRCGPSQEPKRLILPVAPRANHRLRFAPAGKIPPAMLPGEALRMVEEMLAHGFAIKAVEIAGPGDPLAAIDPTLETLQLLRRKYPQLPLEVATLGLGGSRHAWSLAEAGATRITLLVDSVDPEGAAKLYAWVRPGTRTVPLAQAVRLLVNEQVEAVAACRRAGLGVGIRTTVFPGFNDQQAAEIARSMAAAGAEDISFLPCKPGPGDDDLLKPPDQALMDKVRAQASQHLALAEEEESGFLDPAGPVQAGLPQTSSGRPNVAVVSSNGMEIDLHLGHAIQLLIYGPRQDGLPCLLETRPAPEPGGGSSRWEALADALPDCFALLTANAGRSPRDILGRRGIRVLISEDDIQGLVDVLYGGGQKGKKQS